MNKLVQGVKYSLYYSLLYALMFYGIFYGLNLLAAIIESISSGIFNLQHLSLSNSVLFLTVFTSLKLGSDFKMLLQNGYSRVYIFLIAIIRTIILCLIMAVFDIICARLFFNSWESIFLLNTYKTNEILLIFFLFTINMFFSSFGMLLTRIYSLVGIKLRIVLIILSIYLFTMIISGIGYMFGEQFTSFLRFIFGLQNPINPNIFAPIFFILMASIILNSLSYLFIRKMEIK